MALETNMGFSKMIGHTKLPRLAVVWIGAVLILISVAAFSEASWGDTDKMDADTHTVVIEKLEKALDKAQEDETVSLAPVRSRLADLYSDRARLREMEEAKKNCTGCMGSSRDRARAIVLYKAVIAESSVEEQGPLLIHVAHLHELINQPAKAEDIYSSIIQAGGKKHSNEVLAKAYAGRGERRYARAEYKNSQTDFEAALKLASKYKRGPIAHRIAWCELNNGDQETAVSMLLAVLRNPDMLKRESTEGPTLDASFQEEVVLDLATFFARGDISERDVRTVEKMAPKGAELRVMKHLAQECERLGQPKAALVAWSIATTYQPEGSEKLETWVRVARIRYNMGQKVEAQKAFETATSMWSEEGCTEKVECENLRKQLRNLITDWNKAETKKPTEQLLGVYRAYLTTFDKDVEMTYFAAQTARSLKHYEEASALYHKSSLLAVKSDIPTAKDILESSLGAAIEMAELAPKGKESFDLRAAAYDHYLKLSPNGKMAHEVRYQRARLPYEAGFNDEASSRLETFAMSKSCKTKNETDRKLCVQATDLDLDARVLLKDDVAVEKGALAYSKAYPERKLDYLKIARQSALKQAITMEPSRAITKLASIDTTGMDREERIRLLKNRLTLSEKAKDLVALRAAGSELLSIKGIDEKDREFAISRLAWAAEMSFDFASAYALSQKMEMKELRPDERELRLSMFAELAGKNPTRHQEAFLKLSKNSAKRAVIRAKLVRASSNPARELRRHEEELKRFPSLLAPLVLEIYAKTGDRSFAEKALRTRAVAAQPAGRALARQLFLQDFIKVDSKLASHVIRTRTESQMQATLGERIQLIGKVEVIATKAIKSQDWTSQLVTLSVLSRENKRLYSEVLVLPVPKKLNGNDRVNYMKLIEENANMFLAKHEAIEKKLAGFWQDSKAFETLVEDYETATRPELRRVLARELKIIAAVAPSGRRSKLQDAIGTGLDLPDAREVASVIRDIRAKPFNEGRLSKLRELELVRGRETMVAYLDARLTKLKEETRQ